MAITSVSVSPVSTIVKPGYLIQLTSTVVITAGSAQTVTWSSSDGLVSVSSTGLVTIPLSYYSTVTITATSTVDATKKGSATIGSPSVSNMSTFGISIDEGLIMPLYKFTGRISTFGIMFDAGSAPPIYKVSSVLPSFGVSINVTTMPNLNFQGPKINSPWINSMRLNILSPNVNTIKQANLQFWGVSAKTVVDSMMWYQLN